MSQIIDTNLAEQESNERPYGDFQLEQSTLTKEAFFRKEGKTYGVIEDESGNYIFGLTLAVSTEALTYALLETPDMEDAFRMHQDIFSKYIKQTDKIQMLDTTQFDVSQLNYATVTKKDFWSSVRNGYVTDARVISAIFQHELKVELADATKDELLEVVSKSVKKSKKVAKEVYGATEEQLYFESKPIAEDPWMKTSVNAYGEHYYDNSKAEVLVLATNDNLYLEDGKVNRDAKFWLNYEFLPAQARVLPMFPGGGIESIEKLRSDKPFKRRNSDEIDTELKAQIGHILNTGADPLIACAAMEVAQETGFSCLSSETKYHRLGIVHAGLDTTNAVSELVVISDVLDHNEFGRDSADEPFELKGESWTLREIMLGILGGVITDTRLIAFVAKLINSDSTLKSVSVTYEG